MNRPPISVAVDLVVFTIRAQKLQTLLIRRRGKPHEGKWALPGGFVELPESLEEAARRELEEERQADIASGKKGKTVSQLAVYSGAIQLHKGAGGKTGWYMRPRLFCARASP